jgi:hypothetical protein
MILHSVPEKENLWAGATGTTGTTGASHPMAPALCELAKPAPRD